MPQQAVFPAWRQALQQVLDYSRILLLAIFSKPLPEAVELSDSRSVDVNALPLSAGDIDLPAPETADERKKMTIVRHKDKPASMVDG